MFPNAVMMKRETWNDVLRAMVARAGRTRVEGMTNVEIKMTKE